MHAQEIDMFGSSRGSGRLRQLAQRHSEFALDAADDANGLQMRVLGDGQAQKDGLALSGCGGDCLEPMQFARRLDGYEADPGLDRGRQSSTGTRARMGQGAKPVGKLGDSDWHFPGGLAAQSERGLIRLSRSFLDSCDDDPVPTHSLSTVKIASATLR